ncbi:MAG: hypothetical protein ABJA81_01865 [Nocardioidaceae bacterium]
MTRTSRLWLRRVGTACAWGLTVWGFTAWVGLRPEPALVIGLTLVLFVAGWLVAGIAAETAPVEWKPLHRSSGSTFGLDQRFSRLSQSFSDGTDPQYVADQVHHILVRVIDDRLAARHGIDRQTDPQAARVVLGERLTSYVEQPPRPRRGNVSYLSDLVTRIESL